MAQLTVPIYIRAIWIGLRTGIYDTVYYHDNSFWDTFSTSTTTHWVVLWVATVSFAMAASVVVALVRLIAAATEDQFTSMALPLAYGIIQALYRLFILYEPFMYLMFKERKYRSLVLSPRTLEFLVIVLLAIVTAAIVGF